jgi:hypothetical protein
VRATEDVAASDDDGEFGPGLDRLYDPLRRRVEAFGVDPVPALARQALPREFQDDAPYGAEFRGAGPVDLTREFGRVVHGRR